MAARASLLFLLSPIKVPLAGQPAQPGHAVGLGDVHVPAVGWVAALQGQRGRDVAAAMPGLQPLVLLAKDPAQGGLDALLLGGGRRCGCPLLGRHLCRV